MGARAVGQTGDRAPVDGLPTTATHFPPCTSPASHAHNASCQTFVLALKSRARAGEGVLPTTTHTTMGRTTSMGEGMNVWNTNGWRPLSKGTAS